MPSRRSIPSHAIVRRALLERLDRGAAGPLTVVQAHAGSGKSVLLTQWVTDRTDASTVWLDITAADDDPVHFAHRLLGALASADPRFAAIMPLVTIGTGGLGRPLVETLVFELGEAGHTVIVLDDLHLMANALILEDIAHLAAGMPPNAHLVIASRTELPFTFRRRLHADVVEITQADLAMGFADTSELLKRLTGRTITTANVRTLIDKTEGWVAGLLLAGVSLRGREDSDTYVAQFAGTDRRVAEYLGEEVLAAQSPERRSALLQLSALDQMSEQLILGVLPGDTPRVLFDELERNSMFLVPLDDRPGWFRFHHLFGSMLRHRLRSEDPGIEHDLALKAADWHLERGEAPDAIDYLLRAREWDRALDTMLDRGPAVFERGEMATMVRWIREVPQSVLSTRPDVVTIRGILMGLDGQAAEAEDILRRIVSDPTTPFGLVVCAQAYIASLAQWRPHPEISVRHAERALELIDELGDGPTPDLLHLSDPRSLETTTLFSGGRAHFLLGDMVAAREWLARALASEGAGYSLWRISALGSLALVEAWCGRTTLADEFAREALVIAKHVGSLNHPSIADAYLALTVVALDAGDTENSALWLHEAQARATSNGRMQLLWVASMLHTLLSDAGALVEMPPTPDGPPPPLVADKLLASRNEGLRMRGRSGEIRWPAGRPVDPRTASFLEHVIEDIEESREIPLSVDEWLVFGPSDDHDPRSHTERLLTRSRRALADDRVAEANLHLQEAIVVAEPHNLVELFAKAGPFIIDRLGTTRTGAPFRQAIVDRWKEGAASAATKPPVAARSRLTTRELEILPYLPTHITNGDLASELFISLNTVKTHIAHIYEKLGVAGRAAAIKRARELGLL